MTSGTKVAFSWAPDGVRRISPAVRRQCRTLKLRNEPNSHVGAGRQGARMSGNALPREKQNLQIKANLLR
ncbi:MAG TPA: hypothetical protein VN823_27175 [Stellaceae bacterium]|nr:hypothetical protein [Stellaceae bacterium]